jgi:hypothetical protein
MVVERPSFFSVGNPTTEFGDIRIVSSPRTSKTRPVRPVLMVSPGLRFACCVSDAGWAPEVVIQTSPDDLLTDQIPSSEALALEIIPKSNAAVRMRDKFRNIQSSMGPRCPWAYRKCFNIELAEPG